MSDIIFMIVRCHVLAVCTAMHLYHGWTPYTEECTTQCHALNPALALSKSSICSFKTCIWRSFVLRKIALRHHSLKPASHNAPSTWRSDNEPEFRFWQPKTVHITMTNVAEIFLMFFPPPS